MKSALLLLNYVNDLVHPKGLLNAAVPMISDHKILFRVNEAIGLARSRELPIFFANLTFEPDYSNSSPHSPLFSIIQEKGALKQGEWGSSIHEGVDKRDDDILILHPRISPFYKTSLEQELRKKGVEELLIGGVSTEIAVQSAVRDAHDRDFQLTVLKDISAARSEEIHEECLAQLERLATIAALEEL